MVSFVRVEKDGTSYMGPYPRVYKGPPWRLVPPRQVQFPKVPRIIVTDQKTAVMKGPSYKVLFAMRPNAGTPDPAKAEDIKPKAAEVSLESEPKDIVVAGDVAAVGKEG
jgi:hypothetical protein